MIFRKFDLFLNASEAVTFKGVHDGNELQNNSKFLYFI
jgi:hypothetical protein